MRNELTGEWVSGQPRASPSGLVSPDVEPDGFTVVVTIMCGHVSPSGLRSNSRGVRESDLCNRIAIPLVLSLLIFIFIFICSM